MSPANTRPGSKQTRAGSGRRVLVRFLDGPLAGQGNIRRADGGLDLSFPEHLFGWPLPARLRALTHRGVGSVAVWDADHPEDSGLPDVIIESPNAVTYRKVSESTLTSDQIAPMTRVLRGAAYQLVPPSSPVVDGSPR